jgi:hypothetical protein
VSLVTWLSAVAVGTSPERCAGVRTLPAHGATLPTDGQVAVWWPDALHGERVRYHVVNETADGDAAVAYARRSTVYQEGAVFDELLLDGDLRPGILTISTTHPGLGFGTEPRTALLVELLVADPVDADPFDADPPTAPGLRVTHRVFGRADFDVRFEIEGERDDTWTEISASPDRAFRRRVVTAAPTEARDGAPAWGRQPCEDAPPGLRGDQDMFWRARLVDAAGRRSPWSEVVHERTSGCATGVGRPLVSGWLVAAAFRRRRPTLRPT